MRLFFLTSECLLRRCACLQKFIIQRLHLSSSYFNPPTTLRRRIAPAWNDTQGSPDLGFRRQVLQGVLGSFHGYLLRTCEFNYFPNVCCAGIVSDGNAFMMGGIAGHAGLFSTAHDTYVLLSSLAFATPDDPWINAATVRTFTTTANASFSSRALGWYVDAHEQL